MSADLLNEKAQMNPSGSMGTDSTVSERGRSLIREATRLYLMVHVVASMTGVYSFVESRWYGGNIFEYFGFLALMLHFSVDPKYWARLSVVIPYAAMVLLYFILGLLSSPRTGELLKPALYTYASLTLLTCALPAVISDVIDLRRFARVVQIAAIVCLGVCIAEGTIPRVAEFLAQSGPLDASEIRYHAFRASGFMRNPNESANFFIIALLCSSWCSGPARIFGIAAEMAGTYLSASRSGAFLLVASLLILGAGRVRYRAWKSRRNPAFLFAGPILACLLVICAISLLNPVLFSYTESGLSRAGRILDSAEGVKERRIITDYWLPKALDAPVHGHGLRTFQGGWPNGLSSARINDQGTHNMWLMLLGEVGPVGPLALLLILWIAFLRIIHMRDHPMDRLALLLLWGAYLAFSAKAHTLFDYRCYTVVICLLLYVPSLFAKVGSTGQQRTAATSSAET